jgi:hypothetical protein
LEIGYDVLVLQMMRTVVAGIFAVYLSAVIAQDRDWNCPPTPALPDKWEKWFVGSIGSGGARMHLIGAGTVAKGEFYLQTDWNPVFVGGRLQSDGTLLLHDEQQSSCGTDDECAGSGLLRVRLANTGLNGTWKRSLGDHAMVLEMRVEPTPKCEVGGPKRAFREPSWPMTFEYPTAWHLEVTGETVALLCPDPAWMANEGSNIFLKMRKLASKGDLPNEAMLTEFSRDTRGTGVMKAPSEVALNPPF